METTNKVMYGHDKDLNDIIMLKRMWILDGCVEGVL